MPKASKETASETVEVEGYEGHFEHFDGGYSVGFETYTADADLAPLFKGLPDDRCQCPHWGRARTGDLRLCKFGARALDGGDSAWLGEVRSGLVRLELPFQGQAVGQVKGGRAARAHASDPYLDWLDRPKFANLAAGLVRLEAVDGSSKRWVEPEQVEELVNSGNYRRV
jgi:hypothetical protein